MYVLFALFFSYRLQSLIRKRIQSFIVALVQPPERLTINRKLSLATQEIIVDRVMLYGDLDAMDELCSQKFVADNVCFSYRCLHVTLFRRKLHTTVRDQNTKQNHVGVENTDSMIFMALTNSFCCKKVVLVL